MADEQETIAPDELETPAIEEVQDENQTEVETEGLEGEDEGKEPEIEYAEIERNGKRFQVPKELEGEFMMQGDYTKKTQEVAEQRKAAEARMAEVEKAYQTSQEVLQARAVMLNMDDQLKQYEGVNWQQLEAEDPMAAMSHWRQYQQLQQQRSQVAQYLDKTHTELSEKTAQETDKRLRETRAFAEKELKGWTPELDSKITEFAIKDLGFTTEALRGAYSPQVYKTLYLAHIGHAALQKQAAAPKTPAPAAQPLTKVAARANPVSGLDDRLSHDEWLKRRNQQVSKRG